MLRTKKPNFYGIEKSPFFKLYPNPATEKINIELQENEPKSSEFIRIHNMLGKEIFKGEISGNLTQEVSLKGNPIGIYVITVIRDGWVESAKIIKQLKKLPAFFN